MEKVIGIDIGGTMTAIAVVSKGYRLSSQTEFRTPIDPAQAVEKIRIYLDKIDPKSKLRCGIALCGLLSPDGKKLYSAPNLKWQDKDIKMLFKEIKRDFIAVNDGTAAAWGSYVTEPAEKSGNLLSVTMGTGIGGGLVLNGCLLFGASEIGHIKLDPAGAVCGCGKKGCLETYIGGKFIPDRVLEWTGLKVRTAQELSKLAESGNKKAIECWQKIGFLAGYALSGIVNLNGVSRIVLGGTVAAGAGKYFFKELKDSLKNNLMQPQYQECRIMISKWDKDISLLGAASVLLTPPGNLNSKRLIRGKD